MGRRTGGEEKVEKEIMWVYWKFNNLSSDERILKID